MGLWHQFGPFGLEGLEGQGLGFKAFLPASPFDLKASGPGARFLSFIKADTPMLGMPFKGLLHLKFVGSAVGKIE